MVMQQVCGTTKTGLKPKTVASFAERQVCPAVPAASCLSLIPAAGEPVGKVSFPSVRGSPRAKSVFFPSDLGYLRARAVSPPSD